MSFLPQPWLSSSLIVHCQENARAMVIRQDLCRLIRDLSNSLSSDNPEHRFSIASLTDEYLSFLSGHRTEVWMGLWTYSQLESFRLGSEDQCFSEYKRNLLKKHFLVIGKLTTGAAVSAANWCRLSRLLGTTPDPSYTSLKYRFSPTLTQTQLMVLARSATQLPPSNPTFLSAQDKQETNPPTCSVVGGTERDTAREHHPSTGSGTSKDKGPKTAEAQCHVTLPSLQPQGDTKNEDSLKKTVKSPDPTPHNPFNCNFPKQQTSEEGGPRAIFTSH